MTIDDLFETCCPSATPTPASQPAPLQTAEKAGEIAEKAIEDIKPETPLEPIEEQPAEPTEITTKTEVKENE